MKNLLILFCALLLTSCSTIILIPTVRTASFVDFTKYDGMYLSQSSADFKFTPLGLVTSYVKSGNEKAKNKKTTKLNSDGWSETVSTNTEYVAMTSQDAIDELCKKAKNLGATGIVNIKIDYIPDVQSGMYYGYSASGMAIKTN